MSRKEYEIEFHDDGRVTIDEIEHEGITYETDPNPTFREKMGKKLRDMPRAMKVVLVLLFDVYGFLYRFSGNRIAQVIFGWCSLLLIPNIVMMFTMSITVGFRISIWLPVTPALVIWLIDIVSVMLKNDISFLGDRKYKNFEG